MFFPKLNYAGGKVFSLKNIDGGLNLKKAPHLIGDGELADCLNMNFNDGVLKKREPYKALTLPNGYEVLNISADDYILMLKTERARNGNKTFKFAKMDNSGEITYFTDLNVTTDEIGSETYYPENYFVYSFMEKVYLAVAFLSEEQVFGMGKIYVSGENSFSLIPENEIYAPLVMINGKGNMFSSLPASDSTVYSPAVTFEGINLLCNRVRVRFTTDGVSYSFPFTLNRKATTNVTVRLTGGFTSGEILNETVTISDGHEALIPGTNGIYARIKDYTSVVFTRAASGNTPMADVAPLASSFAGNLEIEFYLEENKNAESFYKNSLSVPFGGSGGSGKGTRLFVAGNQAEKNMLRWSDLNNPLYFPENNYAAVGSGSILSLNKDKNMLLIFSENEIHYASYVGGEYSANDVLNGAVADVTAVAASFPITQIKGDIGLITPNSVTEYKGTLYFIGSDKKVYALIGTKLKDIGENIEPLLKDLNAPSLSKTEKGILLTDGNTSLFFNGGWYKYAFSYSVNFSKNIKDRIFMFCENCILTSGGTEEFAYFATLKTFNMESQNKKNFIYLNVLGSGGEIEYRFNDGSLFTKRNFLGLCYLGAKCKKSITVKLKNIDKIEGILIAYTNFIK